MIKRSGKILRPRYAHSQPGRAEARFLNASKKQFMHEVQFMASIVCLCEPKFGSPKSRQTFWGIIGVPATVDRLCGAKAQESGWIFAVTGGKRTIVRDRPGTGKRKNSTPRPHYFRSRTAGIRKGTACGPLFFFVFARKATRYTSRAPAKQRWGDFSGGKLSLY